MKLNITSLKKAFNQLEISVRYLNSDLAKQDPNLQYTIS